MFLIMSFLFFLLLILSLSFHYFRYGGTRLLPVGAFWAHLSFQLSGCHRECRLWPHGSRTLCQTWLRLRWLSKWRHDDVWRALFWAPKVSNQNTGYAVWLYQPVPWWFTALSEDQLLLRARLVCLTHWGRVTHICVSKINVICSDNGLSPGRRQAIIWINARILIVRHREHIWTKS